jgi:hypothetical protein
MNVYSGSDRLIEKSGNKIPEMFFTQKPATFTEQGEKHIPNTIQLWLKRLHLGKKQWISLLHVEERKGWFYMDILVINRETPLEVPVPLEMFLNEQEFASVKYDVLRDLTGLADIFPEIGSYIENNPFRSTAMTLWMFLYAFFQCCGFLASKC